MIPLILPFLPRGAVSRRSARRSDRALVLIATDGLLDRRAGAAAAHRLALDEGGGGGAAAVHQRDAPVVVQPGIVRVEGQALIGERDGAREVAAHVGARRLGGELRRAHPRIARDVYALEWFEPGARPDGKQRASREEK